MTKLAILVPCYNEQEIIEHTNAELILLLNSLVAQKKISSDSFIYYIDDGSSDKTWSLIEKASKASDKVKAIKLSRNFGHQGALVAGLHGVLDKCDINICIDADLQHDITKIPDFVQKYVEGFEIVYGVKNERKSDSFFKKMSAMAFYKVMKLFGVNIVYNHADFRLLSNRVTKNLLEYNEVNLFLRGMIPLLGFKSTCIYYNINERTAGYSKYSLSRMISLALDGITSFSTSPLRFISILGITISFFSFLSALYFVYSYFFFFVVPGWSSIIVTICFFGGINLICLGIMGEYIGKIYKEVKARPRYIIDQQIN